ncbi:MAG TPA: hypothetical protein DHW82_14115 [Spirochaetia bacterium]|nr:MAG: hypothetical protein A2Y41_12065 [Spirochaetes bacterium GWB1_36_13]HCL58125.1 hypothetical protein [Spirochaetia bacterium]
MQKKTIKLLLIEDNPGDARIVEENLKDVPGIDFLLQKTIRLGEGITLLKKESFDVVLLDLSLPDSQGLNTFIKMKEAFPELPIVVLTGFDDENQAFEAYGKGVQNYLMKGKITAKLLGHSVQYAIQKKMAMSELEKK